MSASVGGELVRERGKGPRIDFSTTQWEASVWLGLHCLVPTMLNPHIKLEFPTLHINFCFHVALVNTLVLTSKIST